MNAPFCFIIKWYPIQGSLNGRTQQKDIGVVKGRILCHLPLQSGCLQGQGDRNLGKLIHGDGQQALDGQMFKLDLEKAEEPEIKLPTSAGSSKKQESSRKTSTSALLITPKPLTLLWITTNCGNFLKGWEYQTTWPASWEICVQIRKQQLELDMERQTGSRSGREYVKVVYCHPAYLTYMLSTSCKMPGWMKYKLESRLPGEISITSDKADDTTLMAESKEELESLFDKNEREEWKKLA